MSHDSNREKSSCGWDDPLIWWCSLDVNYLFHRKDFRSDGAEARQIGSDTSQRPVEFSIEPHPCLSVKFGGADDEI